MPILDPEIETVRVILPRPQVVRLSDTEIAPGSGGGAFIQLSDVPNSYAGQSLKVVRVNAGETGLEFSTGGSGAVSSVFGRTGAVVAASGDYTATQVTGAVANTRAIGTTAPITGGGDLSADRTLAMHVADTTHDGYLSSTDWNTFNTSASGSYVPTSRTLHIGPTTSDLSANRSFITNVTDDAQTKAAIVPNTAPSAGQALVGNAGGTAYAPQTLSGSGATISLASTGVVSISSIANASLSNSAITIGGVSTSLGGSALGNVTNDTQTQASIVPNTTPSAGQVLVGNAGNTAYVKQTLSGSGATITLGATGVMTISAIANASLSNTAVANLSGTNTGDQTSVSGNAGTATALQNARTIGGVSFDGTGNIVPQTIQSVNEATDTTCFPLFISASGSQSLQPLNNTALTFNSNTGALGATSFTGAGTGLTGTAASLTAGNVTTNANLTGVVTSSGNATSLGSFTSANLRTALTDENGTGAALFDSSTSATFITPLLGTPTSGVLSNCTTATQSAGDNSTKLASTAYADAAGSGHAVYAGASPPTTDVGVFTVVKTGIDFKTNAVTDIFTVPSGRTFVCHYAYIVTTTVSGGLAVAVVWAIRESGGSLAMTSATAMSSQAPLTTLAHSQVGTAGAGNVANPALCAAAAKVQFNLTTAWTTSTTVTGSVFVVGQYVT